MRSFQVVFPSTVEIEVPGEEEFWLPLEKTFLVSLLAISTDLEIVAINIHLKRNKSIVLCCVYRPPTPSNCVCQRVLEYLHTLSCTCQGPLVIVGDFNLPGVNWPLLSGSSPLENSFCELAYDLNLTQVIDSPTHTQGNILDLVFTNDPSLIINTSVSSDLTSFISTDHLTVSFSLSTSIKPHPKSPSKHVPDYSKADWEGLCLHLLELDFSPCYRSQNIEYVWSYIKRTIKLSSFVCSNGQNTLKATPKVDNSKPTTSIKLPALTSKKNG